VRRPAGEGDPRGQHAAGRLPGQLDRDLLALARQPSSAYLRSDVFRDIRTLKTTSAFVGLRRISRAAAAGEELAGLIRSGSQPATPRAVRELGGLVHALRMALVDVERRGGDAGFDITAAIRGVAAFLPHEPVPALTAGLAGAVRSSGLIGLRAVRLVSRPIWQAVNRFDAVAEASAANLAGRPAGPAGGDGPLSRRDPLAG
jgi:hypothetical protein